MSTVRRSGEPMNDQRLWGAVVAAEQCMARAQSKFYRDAQSRVETLRVALRKSKWETGAALSFLRVLGADVPDLLPELVGLCLSDAWARDARQAIAAGNRETVVPRLDGIVRNRLATADGYEFRRLGEMLVHVHAWPTLRALVVRALSSEDHEIREVGGDLEDAYGSMIASE